jgi:hypothetical protein
LEGIDIADYQTDTSVHNEVIKNAIAKTLGGGSTKHIVDLVVEDSPETSAKTQTKEVTGQYTAHVKSNAPSQKEHLHHKKKHAQMKHHTKSHHSQEKKKRSSNKVAARKRVSQHVEPHRVQKTSQHAAKHVQTSKHSHSSKVVADHKHAAVLVADRKPVLASAEIAQTGSHHHHHHPEPQKITKQQQQHKQRLHNQQQRSKMQRHEKNQSRRNQKQSVGSLNKPRAGAGAGTAGDSNEIPAHINAGKRRRSVVLRYTVSMPQTYYTQASLVQMLEDSTLDGTFDENLHYYAAPAELNAARLLFVRSTSVAPDQSGVSGGEGTSGGGGGGGSSAFNPSTSTIALLSGGGVIALVVAALLSRFLYNMCSPVSALQVTAINDIPPSHFNV